MSEIIRNEWTDQASLTEIAQSINQIKAEVRDVAIRGAIEIGQRLQAAKSMVPYGEWGKWLSENVDYSERTAQDLMRIASEYGRKETQALAEIQNTTQAVMLLALDSGERERFIQEHDMAVLSTRDLEIELTKIKEERAKQQLTIEDLMSQVTDLTGRLDDASGPAPEQAEALEAERKRADDLDHSLEQARKQVLEAEQRREADVNRERETARKAQAEALEARKKAEAQDKRIARMEEELKAAREDVRVVEVLPQGMEEELARLRAQAARTGAENDMRAAFESLKYAFERLVGMVEEAESVEPETALKYKAAFHRVMLNMAERMK